MRRKALSILAVPALLTGSLLAQTHPNLERGMNVGKAYQVGDVDSVNLFNGNLSIAIPLGQSYGAGGDLSYSVVLRYNSNVWDHNLVTFTNDCTRPYGDITVTQTTPHQLSSGLNGGLGWSLDFGTLLLSGSGTVDDRWTYVAPDGSTHPFYWTMHEGETQQAGYRYTRDGTYMRLVASNYCSIPSCSAGCSAGWLEATVEFADGRRQTFSRLNTCGLFVLKSEIDRFGNSLNFTEDAAGNRWLLSDSQGREHRIGLRWLDGYNYRVVDYVDLAAFDDPGVAGVQRAVYTFVYETREIARSCKHYYDPWWNTCDPQLPPTVTVPLLIAVTQPDGAQWTMGSTTLPAYNLDGVVLCNPLTIPRDRPGTITNLKNPVGGTYSWTYGTWSNPAGSESCYSGEGDIVKDATGVYDRTLADPLNGSGGGLWQYRHDSWHLPTGEVDSAAQDSWTTVTTPESDQSKHFFRTQYCGTAAEGWDYGLPYTRGRNGTGSEPYLSTEQYDGSATDPAHLRRTSYLRYDKDAVNASWTASYKQQTNRRVDFEMTVFADDGNHSTTVNRSDFDGLGHYRVVTTGGDFGSGNSRQTTTAYNGTLSYPQGTPPAEWWPSASPWVINTYASSKSAEGGDIAKSEACFEPSTGYLLRSRALKLTGTGGADPGQSTGDVVLRRTHTSGNTTREESFGGDTQAVGIEALCGLSLPAATYRIDHTYEYGSLKSSRYADSAGAPLSFYLVDRGLDPSTGLTATSRDSAGLATDFVYDTMGRLTSEKPRTSPVNGGAWVQHCYTMAVPPTTPARIDSLWWPNGTAPECGSSQTTLQRSTVDVDGFGRASRERRLLFGGSWAQRLTTYNGLGWTTSVSEWQAETPPAVKKTEYLGFDPFGRPTTIRPADGAAHDTTLSYWGIRLASRSVKIAMTPGTETTSTTTEEYDRQGRLWKVTEPSGASGANVTTTYDYDIGGRLKQASTPSDVTQNRVFTYDNRGFLLSEQLPELGTSGNGTVTYSKYDARGHARRVQDGAHDLAFTFDAAERLTHVAQADASGNPGSPLLKALTYATANAGTNLRNGKLETATSYNPDLTTASVVETYTYGGLGGRVSSRQTAVEGRTINQTFTWNDLGRISSLGYPDDSVLGTILDPPRTITHTYAQGALTAVGSYLPSISYHPNGMVSQVLRNVDSKDIFAKDDNDMPRPAGISLQRTWDSAALWQTGAYEYDGAGNVKKIGSDSSTYDGVGRLTMGTTSAGTVRQCASYNAFGAVTGLGTGTTSCTPSTIGVDAATNRLGSPVTYDASGNVMAWGGSSYTWNRLGQMLTTTGTGINRNYVYTADGERVLDRNTLDNTRSLWIRDLDGRVLREYGRSTAGAWSWSKDYVYRDGQLATIVTPMAVRHVHLDHLGSVRRMTDGALKLLLVTGASRDFYPFGMEATAATETERMRFAGHQRDTFGTAGQTDDLDYMHARYYSPIVGRFLSLDPVRGNPSQPQSWNMYSYARNNPLKYVDPTGALLELHGNATEKAEVASMANDNMYGVALKVSKTGAASLSSTGAIGPPTQSQAAMADVLKAAINDPKKMTLGLTTGSSSVLTGNWSTGAIDLADMRRFGNGPGPTSAGKLGHEIREQFLKQIKGESDFATAHGMASATESAITGWTRAPRDSGRMNGLNTGFVIQSFERGGLFIRARQVIKEGNIVDVVRE